MRALVQGTASTLTRAEVRGGGRKPFAQKGTGNARMGSKRTPLRPGGGVVFGPKVCGLFAFMFEPRCAAELSMGRCGRPWGGCVLQANNKLLGMCM